MPDQNHPMLYTPEQKLRRDASVWTLVQGILAPVQFIIFLVSLGLVLRCLMTGEGEEIALWSVVVKTIALYTIMVTGSIWEKVVFDKFLFADAFFWEDVFSMLVLALHTLYLWAHKYRVCRAKTSMLNTSSQKNASAKRNLSKTTFSQILPVTMMV